MVYFREDTFDCPGKKIIPDRQRSHRVAGDGSVWRYPITDNLTDDERREVAIALGIIDPRVGE